MHSGLPHINVKTQHVAGIIAVTLDRGVCPLVQAIDSVLLRLLPVDNLPLQLDQPLRLIQRLPAVKDAHLFHLPHRLHLGENVAGLDVFDPVPGVPVSLDVAVDQSGGKRLGREQRNDAVSLDPPLIHPPHSIERQRAVPPAVCDAVGRVAEHHVNAPVRDLFRQLQAVTSQQFDFIVFHVFTFLWGRKNGGCTLLCSRHSRFLLSITISDDARDIKCHGVASFSKYR